MGLLSDIDDAGRFVFLIVRVFTRRGAPSEASEDQGREQGANAPRDPE